MTIQFGSFIYIRREESHGPDPYNYLLPEEAFATPIRQFSLAERRTYAETRLARRPDEPAEIFEYNWVGSPGTELEFAL